MEVGSLFIFHPSGMYDRDDKPERSGDKVPCSNTLSALLLVVRNGTQRNLTYRTYRLGKG